MKIVFTSAIGILLCLACTKNNSDSSNTTEIPAVYKKIYGANDMYMDGDYIVIKTNGRPDHKSPYYEGTQWETTLYEAYTGSNSSYFKGPGSIGNQNLTIRLPLHPKKAASVTATPLGPIGISLNGVVFFNQYAGNGAPLGPGELNTFDQYNGHPAQTQYHYHAEPFYLTANKGKDALLGFLLDGFPVYGPIEESEAVDNSNLDACHGHTHATADFPDGIYHYHVTAEAPYINGSGFYGTPGAITR